MLHIHQKSLEITDSWPYTDTNVRHAYTLISKVSNNEELPPCHGPDRAGERSEGAWTIHTQHLLTFVAEEEAREGWSKEGRPSFIPLFVFQVPRTPGANETLNYKIKTNGHDANEHPRNASETDRLCFLPASSQAAP